MSKSSTATKKRKLESPQNLYDLQKGTTELDLEESNFLWTVQNTNRVWTDHSCRCIISPPFTISRSMPDELWSLMLDFADTTVEDANKGCVSLYLLPQSAMIRSIEVEINMYVFDGDMQNRNLIYNQKITFQRGKKVGVGPKRVLTKSKFKDEKFNPINFLCNTKIIKSIASFDTTLKPREVVRPPSMAKCFNDARFSDFKVVCGNETFHVHKVFLSGASAVFNTMLSTDMVEKRNNKLTLDQDNPRVVEQMLGFVYGLPVDFEKCDEAAKLFDLANRYEMPGLKIICEQRLLKCMNLENAWDMLCLSDMMGSLVFKKRILQFLSENKRLVFNNEKDSAFSLSSMPRSQKLMMMGQVFEYEVSNYFYSKFERLRIKRVFFKISDNYQIRK